MVLVRRIHNRGANIVVEAHGEVIFTSQGAAGRFTRRLRERVAAAAVAEAPTNKRPRWAHYGAPLKSTIRRSSTYHPSRMRAYAAVGSTSPHAYYVDQGTGIYAGNAPYEAKVLPPWTQGDSSLYEHTWRPGGPGSRRVAKVMIRGQRGQFFFDTALKRGFQSMRMRSYQLPGEGASGVKDALASIPSGLTGFLGNTIASGSFIAQLEEWRAWRDAAWNAGEKLNRSPYDSAGAAARARARAKKARAKAKTKAQTKVTKPPPRKPPIQKPPPTKPPVKGWASVADKKRAAVLAFKQRNPSIRVVSEKPGGIVVQTVKGPVLIPWSRLYDLL